MPAHARERAVLQEPEQLGLERAAHVGNLIQENRAAVGLFDAAGLLPVGAGEGAFFVAEEFAFQEGLGNGGAIDAHIVGLVAAAQAVQGAGHQLLAGAAFSEDQDPGFRGGHGLNELAQLAHLGAFADDLVQAVGLAGARAQAGVFLQEPVTLGATVDGVQQFLGGKGFGQVVHGSRLDGLHRQLGGRVGGNHQQRQLRPLRPGLGQKLIPAHPAQARVGDDHEELLALEQAQRPLRRFDRAHGIALVGQHRLERQAHILLVIDDEDRWQGDAHLI